MPGSFAVRHATADALKYGRGGAAVRLGSHRLRDCLVITETALALVLLVGAGLLTKSLLRLQDVYPGFKAGGVVTMELSLPEAQYPSLEAVADGFSTITKNVARLPEIGSVAFVISPSVWRNDYGQLIPRLKPTRDEANLLMRS